MIDPTPNPLPAQVLVAIISSIGGVGIALVTRLIAQRRRKALPPDRMQVIFEGYEKLLKNQQVDIDRKSASIVSLEAVVHQLEDELDKIRDTLNQTRTELSTARIENEQLKVQLSDMRTNYKATGNI